MHYNGLVVIYLLSSLEICKSKGKDSEINLAPFFRVNASKDFSADNMSNTRLSRYVYDFSVDYYITDVPDTINIHKYLTERAWCKYITMPYNNIWIYLKNNYCIINGNL